MCRILLFITLIFATALHCLGFDGSGTVVSQGISRSFLYHAPGVTVPTGLPIVIIFHGTGGNAQAIKTSSGFDAVSDANNFIAIYPNSTNIGGSAQWNVYTDDVSGHGGIGEEATDDVIFADDLIDWFCTNHSIDASKIYAAGHSNGGYMAYALAVRRPNVFAGVASVAGNLWGDDPFLSNYFSSEYQPVSVLHIHGDADATVEYPNPTHATDTYVWPLSAFGMGNCSMTDHTVITVNPSVLRLVFCDGSIPGTKRVELIRLVEHEHSWPSLPNFNPAATIWGFFSGVTNGASSNCLGSGIEEMHATFDRMQVHPNPTNGLVRFSIPVLAGTMVRVMDASGRAVREEVIHMNAYDVNDLAPGWYTLQLIGRDGTRAAAKLVKD